jgi:hypothetical protein
VLIPILAGAFATVIAAATPLYLGIVEKNLEAKKAADDSGRKADVAYDLLKQHVQYLEVDIAEIKKSMEDIKHKSFEDSVADEANLIQKMASLPAREIKKITKALSDERDSLSSDLKALEGVGSLGSAGSGSGGSVAPPTAIQKPVDLPKILPKALPKAVPVKVQQERKALPTSLDDAVKGL